MSDQKRRPTGPVEEREASEAGMDALVGYILLSGVLLSMALVAVGLIWHWVSSGQLTLTYLLGGQDFFHFLLADIRAFFTGPPRPQSLVSMGIAVLMLTPFTRVLASMVYFALVPHNWKYVAFTGFVLGVLTYSLFLG